MSFGNQHTTAINLTFVLGNTRRFFAFVYFANIYSSRRRKGFEREQPKLSECNFWDVFNRQFKKRSSKSRSVIISRTGSKK